MQKVRVIDTKTLRCYFGQEALDVVKSQQSDTLLIDQYVGIDKKGREVYNNDILENRQKQKITINADTTKYSQKYLKTLILIGNAHKERLETLF